MFFLEQKPLHLLHHGVPAQAQSISVLAAQLLRAAIFNFLIVAAAGVLLRAAPLVPHFPVVYKNMLHGHSHFAFGGWVMPALVGLFLQAFPKLAAAVAFRHWRNIGALLMISAYGMLLAFPLQGYKPASLFFATLSIITGYYLAAVVWGAMRLMPACISHRFLKAGICYLLLASLGPFATGPLIKWGYAETPIYYNAIYGYLHFTYNGWFTFAVLALIYKQLESFGRVAHGKKVFWLMQLACIPALALSFLWNKPSPVFNIVGGLAALLQLAATVYFLRDVFPLQWTNNKVRWLVVVSIAALLVKHLLQLASAFSAAAHMAAMGRGFVIAYLHLVLIGFVSVFMLAQIIQHKIIRWNKSCFSGMVLFLAAFAITEGLLVAMGLSLPVPFFLYLLLLLAFAMLAGLLVLYAGSRQPIAAQNDEDP